MYRSRVIALTRRHRDVRRASAERRARQSGARATHGLPSSSGRSRAPYSKSSRSKASPAVTLPSRTRCSVAGPSGSSKGPRQLPAPHDRATEAGRSVAGRAPVVRAQGCRRRCDAGRKRKKVPRVGEQAGAKAPTVSGVAVNFMGNNDGSLGIDRSRFACSGVFANHPRFCHGSL
jgi:hypothetical protein